MNVNQYESKVRRIGTHRAKIMEYSRIFYRRIGNDQSGSKASNASHWAEISI